MTTDTIPVTLDDPTNAAILAVSEDRLEASSTTRSAKSPSAPASTSTTSSSGCGPCCGRHDPPRAPDAA